MAVLAFDRLMRPHLIALDDERSHHLSEPFDPIAESMGLADADRSMQIPSARLRLPGVNDGSIDNLGRKSRLVLSNIYIRTTPYQQIQFMPAGSAAAT